MINWIKRLLARRHKWEYRNPYDRRCRICGRIEVAHCLDDWSRDWWEVFNEGDPSKHGAKS